MATNKNTGEAFHRLIRRVKETEALPDIRFVRSKGFRPVENPVTGYLAACEIESETCRGCFVRKSEKGQTADKYTLLAAVWLYAPKNTSASQLSEKSEVLLREISAADSEGYIVSTKIQPADFSKDEGALVQKISLSLEFVLGEDVDFCEWIIPNSKNTSVFVDGVALSGVNSVLCTEEINYIAVKELLAGVAEYVPVNADYIIKLYMNYEETLEKNDGFTLTVKTPLYVTSYSDCRILRSEKSLKSPNEYEREYTLAATKKSEVKIEE